MIFLGYLDLFYDKVNFFATFTFIWENVAMMVSLEIITAYDLEVGCYIVNAMVNDDMSLVLRKPVICICENKDADQLRGNREADQRLCFRNTPSTIPLLPKHEISSL